VLGPGLNKREEQRVLAPAAREDGAFNGAVGLLNQDSLRPLAPECRATAELPKRST
jgi:hypothetical protein